MEVSMGGTAFGLKSLSILPSDDVRDIDSLIETLLDLSSDHFTPLFSPELRTK